MCSQEGYTASSEINRAASPTANANPLQQKRRGAKAARTAYSFYISSIFSWFFVVLCCLWVFWSWLFLESGRDSRARWAHGLRECDAENPALQLHAAPFRSRVRADMSDSRHVKESVFHSTRLQRLTAARRTGPVRQAQRVCATTLFPTSRPSRLNGDALGVQKTFFSYASDRHYHKKIFLSCISSLITRLKLQKDFSGFAVYVFYVFDMFSIVVYFNHSCTCRWRSATEKISAVEAAVVRGEKARHEK
jgi:hypothetical protein